MSNAVTNIDEIIKCLRRHDEEHDDYYQRRINILKELLSRLEPIDYKCTEDKELAGSHKRVDLYIQTGKGQHILIEAKLCLSSGGSLGRSLLGKAVETLEALDERRIPSLNDVKMIILFILVPHNINMNAICNKLQKYLSDELSEIGCASAELLGISGIVITVGRKNLKVNVKGNDIVVNIQVIHV